jgi:hypothetical protein
MGNFFIAFLLAIGIFVFSCALYYVINAVFLRLFGTKGKLIQPIADGDSQRWGPMKIRLSDLTVWGWILLFATVGVIFVLMIPWGQWLYDILPPGGYPALLIGLPVLLIGICFYAIGALLLNTIGLHVIRRSREEGVGEKKVQRKEVQGELFVLKQKQATETPEKKT